MGAPTLLVLAQVLAPWQLLGQHLMWAGTPGAQPSPALNALQACPSALTHQLARPPPGEEGKMSHGNRQKKQAAVGTSDNGWHAACPPPGGPDTRESCPPHGIMWVDCRGCEWPFVGLGLHVLIFMVPARAWPGDDVIGLCWSGVCVPERMSYAVTNACASLVVKVGRGSQLEHQ